MYKTSNLKIVTILITLLASVLAITSIVRAGNNAQADLIAHGKYIAAIAGCTTCHTPLRAEFQDLTKLTLDQIQTIALDEQSAMDSEKFLAGGRAFNLGPAGVVFTRNLTPDKDSGLGNWTDDQVQSAIRTGQEPSGEMLFPIMPYHTYNSMADADLAAVVAYLRSVNAVSNIVPEHSVDTSMLQPLPDQNGITAPAASDKAKRGEYLVKSVMACTDCHTPIDPATGAPQMDKYLGGGQPYEGPWGIVYGGNITPDSQTGLGDWTESEIKRAVVAGIGKDGRRLILMPWFAYSGLTPEDADAVAFYLKNGLPPVNNEVPAASLNPDFVVMAPQNAGLSTSTIAIIVAVALVITAGLFILLRRKNA